MSPYRLSLANIHSIVWFRSNYSELLRSKDAPHTIAVGAAVGVFFGFIALGLITLILTLLSGSIAG